MAEVRAALAGALREVLGPRRSAFVAGSLASLALAVPDLLRQLPVRDDPSYPHALLVDVVGVLSAAVVQVALVGRLSTGRWSSGPAVLLSAVRRAPLAVLAGLVAAGAVSAVVTVPASVAVLGVRQVVGPLDDPALWRLLVAQASDAVATALTATYWAVLVGRLAGAEAGARR